MKWTWRRSFFVKSNVDIYLLKKTVAIRTSFQLPEASNKPSNDSLNILTKILIVRKKKKTIGKAEIKRKLSDIDLWLIFQMHLARKFILFHSVKDGKTVNVRRGEKDLRVFCAKSSTNYIKCVLNCFAWEHQQLAWKAVSDVMLFKKYWIMFAFQLSPNWLWGFQLSLFFSHNFFSPCSSCRKTETHYIAFQKLRAQVMLAHIKWRKILAKCATFSSLKLSCSVCMIFGLYQNC